MRKLFTQLFSVLMLICVFGFQATTFAATDSWDGENSIPMDEDGNVSPADIATQFVVAFDDVPTITATGGTMAVYQEGGQLLKVIPINNSSSDVQIVDKTIVVNHGMSTIEDESSYYIVLTEGTVTVDGDPVSISAGMWSFTVGDFTAPMLVAEDPLDPVGDGVEANMFDDDFMITMIFDEDVAIGEGTIAIYQADGTVVELIDVENLVGNQAIDIVAETVVITVNDDARFMEEADYYVRVMPGAIVDDVSEYDQGDDEAVPNAYAGIADNTSWTFSTRVNSAPAITADVSDITGDAANLNVTLDADGAFYYLMQLETEDAPADDADVTAWDKISDVEAGVTESVEIVGLMGSTEYEIYIASENDELPINISGPADNKVVFSTLDNTAPIADYTSGDIEDVVNDDSKTTGAIMYFNEEVMAGAGTLSVRKMENNALAAEIDASEVTSTEVDDADDSFDGQWKVVFDFGVELESATEYYIVFPNGFITDLAGNEYANPVVVGEFVSDPVPVAKGDWVLESSDFEVPVVTFWTDTKMTETTADIIDAGNDDVIYVQFDEPVVAVNGQNWNWLNDKEWTEYVSLKLDGLLVDADYDYNSDENRIEITPDSDLESNTEYAVVLRPGLISDESDNVIDAENAITVTTGDNEDPTYEAGSTDALEATTVLTLEFSKDVFVADDEGEIDHAFTTEDLEDILSLEVDAGEGDGMEEVDAADYTAVYDPATMTITVTYSEEWPTSVCDDYTAEVMLIINSEDLIDSKEDNFIGGEDYYWNVEDYVAPGVTLLSGDVEMTDMVADGATIEFSEMVYAEDYSLEDDYLTMFTLKEGSADGKNLKFTVAPLGEGYGYTLMPVMGWDWEADVTYYYGVGAIFEDCAENVASATYGTFTVVADAVDPIVEALTYTVNGGSAIDIEDDAADVEVNDDGDVVVKVTFNMAVDDKDLALINTVTTNFQNIGGDIDVVIVSDDIDGTMLTITIPTPDIPLPSTEYTVTIPAGLLEGNASYEPGMFAQLEDDVVITINTADNKEPEVIGILPSMYQWEIPLDLDEGKLTLTFDEEIQLGSGKIEFTPQIDGVYDEETPEQSITVSFANVEIAEDKLSAVVSVDDMELYSTVYRVIIEAEVFEDLVGNDLGDDENYEFGTVDNEPPVVDEDGLYPADGADLVPLDVQLTMTFTEEVVQASITGSRKLVYIFEKVGDDAEASIDAETGDLVYDATADDDVLHYYTYVEDVDNVGVSGNVVTINNIPALEEGNEYYVLITPGAFKDIAEGEGVSPMPNPIPGEYAGILSYNAEIGEGWDFKTGDVYAPEVSLEFTKLGVDELVAIDSDIEVVFTKAIVDTNGDDLVEADIPTWMHLWKDVDGSWVEIAFTAVLSTDGETVTIENASLVILEEMKGSTHYRVSIDANTIQGEGSEINMGAWGEDGSETEEAATFLTSDYEAPVAPMFAFSGTEADAVWYGKVDEDDDEMVHIADLIISDEAEDEDAINLYYLWTADLDTEFTAENIKDLGEVLTIGMDTEDEEYDLESGESYDLSFNENMVNETEYRLVAVAEDAAGNLSEVEDFTYYTDDVIAPELVGDLPTEFSTDDELMITFNEDVMPMEDAYARIIDKDGIVYMAPLVMLGEDDDDYEITIVISAAGLPLSDDVATYTVEIDGGMIYDVPRMTGDDTPANVPNAYEGLFGSTFTVTTTDQTAPELVSITPDNGDDDPVEVGANPTFTFEFDEAVELNDGFISFAIYEGEYADLDGGEYAVMKSASAPGDAYDVITADNISGEGTSTITITTNRELADKSEYVLVVNGGTFSDMAGNDWMSDGEYVNMISEDTEPLVAIFRMPVYNDDEGTERPFYLPYDGEVPSVPDGQMSIMFGSFEDQDKVYSGFDPDDDDGDVIDHDEYFLSPDEPNIDVFELKDHVYFKVDGVDMPFEIEVSSSYNHKIWIVVDEDDLADYKGMTITYGFINLYDDAGNLNEGEEVSYVIAEDAIVVPDVTFEPGDNDDDSETLVTITTDQVFTLTFNGILFSYDSNEDDNNLIMSLELLEDLAADDNAAVELYDETNDEYIDVELLTYSEESGKSVITLQVEDGLDSETEYTLEVNDNEVIQIGQGNEPMDYYEEHYMTSDVDAPELIADEDGTLDAAYLPAKEGVVGYSETLALVFDEEVVGAGSVEIHLWDGQLVATVDITGNASEDDDDSEWVIEISDIQDIMAANPAFVTNESYYVIVPDTSIVDVATIPNAFAGISTINEWSFDLRDNSTPIPTFVQNEQMGVEVSTSIDITFDREVETNSGWLAIYEELDGDAVELLRIEEDVDFTAGTAFSFDVSGLMAETKYYVELGEGSFVLSADGETEQEQVVIGEWWFSTEIEAVPEPIMFSPAHEPELSYSAIPGQDLVIKFNMDVAPGTGNIQLHNMKTTGDNIISTFDVTDATQVVFTDSTVTIPGDVLNLVLNGAYYVIIPGTAVGNTSSNAEYWEGITTPLAWQFSTGATVPELQSWTPQDTIEGSHPVFVMTFVDTVMFGTAGTLTVTAKDSTEASLVIDITAEMVDGKVVTVAYDTMMTDGLNINTTYIVNVDAGVLVNEQDVPWVGVSNDTDWTFTTGMDFTTDVEELPASADLDYKVYPNPFNNHIRIDNYDKLTRVVITNIAGQRVLDIEYPSYEIQTGNLVTGVYVVTLIANDKIVKSERIIKR